MHQRTADGRRRMAAGTEAKRGQINEAARRISPSRLCRLPSVVPAAVRRPPSAVSSRRERPEGATNVAFSQPLERTVAQLAHSFARDAEHRADLLESVLASALEP